MAVGSRQTDSNSRYDPENDFSSDQLRRYGQVANRAQRAKDKRQLEQNLDGDRLVVRVKKRAMKPIHSFHDKNGKSIRYAIWLFVVLAILLWLMYMTG